MIPAGAGPQPMPRHAIAAKYQVPSTMARRWTLDSTFPAAEPGQSKWKPDLVDAWVRANHPAVWAATRPEPNPLGLPGGDDEDLLTAREFGSLLQITRGRVIPPTTIRAYEARDRVPAADRRPGDGLSPKVPGPRWFRRTVYQHILGSRQLPTDRRPVSESPDGPPRISSPRHDLES